MVHYGNTKTTKSNSELKINKGRYKRNLKRQTGKKNRWDSSGKPNLSRENKYQ